MAPRRHALTDLFLLQVGKITPNSPGFDFLFLTHCFRARCKAFSMNQFPRCSCTRGCGFASIVFLSAFFYGFCRPHLISLQSLTTENIDINQVGAPGFEPGTSCSQSKRASRTALRPDYGKQYTLLGAFSSNRLLNAPGGSRTHNTHLIRVLL